MDLYKLSLGINKSSNNQLNSIKNVNKKKKDIENKIKSQNKKFTINPQFLYFWQVE